MLDNWQEYFELKLVAFVRRGNVFLCQHSIMPERRVDKPSIATDMEVAVEYACTNGYLCWFIYKEETGEITEGDIDERYGRTYEQDGAFTMKE